AGPEWLLQERQILGRSYLQSEARAFALLAKDAPLNLLGMSATVDPFQSLREGRRAFAGSSLYGELNLNSQMVTGGDWGVSLSVTPGLVFAHENSSRIVGKIYLQEGYGKIGYRRTELVVGRIAQRFGDAKHGNLILSSAAKPLDMIKLSVRPHWIKPIDFLGPTAFQTWIGVDSSVTGKKNAKLWGIQWGARPFTFVEFAVMNLMHFGGEGAPSLDVSDYLKMLVGSQSSDLQTKRQQHWGTLLGVWGPGQTFKLYNHLFWETLGRAENWFSQDISWLFGIWFPKFGEGDLRFEWVRTQNDAYSNAIWSQGLTNAGSPLGHPLGNSGQGFYLDLSLSPIEQWRPELELAFEQRNRDHFEGAETESRLGLTLGTTRRWINTELNAQLKVQRIENRFYSAGEPVFEVGAYSFLRYSFF
ncbi:MAG: hypothetical protein EB078_07870, partial [Proteobacteria bacterium]|nr:hypothetical protein [Pseudomonadota bacterium]